MTKNTKAEAGRLGGLKRQAKLRERKPDWRKAEGVVYHRGETNPALAERDYSVKCKTPLYSIIIHEGYHFWWCISHHQPLYACDLGKAKQ